MLDYCTRANNGERELLGWNSVFGLEGSCNINAEQLVSGNTVTNEFYSVPTPTMTTNSNVLKSAFDAEVAKIISGQAPIDSFDAAAEAWLAGGGQTITDEVNEWYANKG